MTSPKPVSRPLRSANATLPEMPGGLLRVGDREGHGRVTFDVPDLLARAQGPRACRPLDPARSRWPA